MSENLNGLKGWLILVAIIVCLGPPNIVYSIVNSLIAISAKWQILDGAIIYYIIFTYILNFVFFIFSIYLIYLFFKKVSKFRLNFIIYIGFSAIISILISFWLVLLAPIIPSLVLMKFAEMFLAVILAAIWIPYMIYSKRAKKTFIN